MRTILSRFLILGVILVVLGGGCATLGNLTGPKYGELVMNYPDGETIVYLLPPEFPELTQETLDIFPISPFIFVARQEIEKDIYGLFLWAPEAIGLGCGMILEGEEGQYWIYDKEGIPQPCTDKELNDLCAEWNYPAIQEQDLDPKDTI